LRKTLLRNLSELVAAVTLARNVQLSAIGAKLPVNVSEEARPQWVRRQLCNDTEDTLQLFRPLAASLLAGFAGRSVRRISSLLIPAREQVAIPAGDQLTSFSRMADQVSSTATIATPSKPTVLA